MGGWLNSGSILLGALSTGAVVSWSSVSSQLLLDPDAQLIQIAAEAEDEGDVSAGEGMRDGMGAVGGDAGAATAGGGGAMAAAGGRGRKAFGRSMSTSNLGGWTIGPGPSVAAGYQTVGFDESID